MSPTRTCPRCQTSFSADIIDAQVGGVCPRCLFQLVMGEAGEVTLKAPSSEAPADSSPELPKHMGNYEILGMIGAGGMGKVYKAKQRGLDRFVAIKVLGGGGQEEIERFFREARASAKLHHPNIIPIHEVVSHEGRYFYAMDFVEGKTLERAVKDGGLPLRQGLEILAKTARAIHFAHENGVVHRDIKPANILLDGRGEPMVADFGLAKDISSEAGLTQSGYLLGTPSYMAPEQAELDRKSEVDAQSDVYSLGATMYFVLTGRPPHDGRSVYEVIAKVVGTDPAAPRSVKANVSRDVETICLKALRKDRASRYATAKELAEDLDRFLAGEPILARPIGLGERLVLKARRHRRPIAVGSAVALLLVVLALLFLRTRPATVDLVTDPPGAAVVVNGNRLAGTTPLPGQRIAPGSVEFRFEREGYSVTRRTVSLSAGSVQELRIPLAPVLGRLTLDLPDGTSARLTDGSGLIREIVCPVKDLEVPVGIYSLRAERPNCPDLVETVRVVADRETQVSRLLPSRLLGRFRTRERTVRDFVLLPWSGNWGILTQDSWYEWMAPYYAAADPVPLAMPPGTTDLLANGYFEDPAGPPRPVMLFKSSNGGLDGRFRFFRHESAWKLELPLRLTMAVAVEGVGKSSDFIVATVGERDAAKVTQIFRVSPEGKIRWSADLPGHRRIVTAGPDVDGDGREEIIAWGEGVSVLSGEHGRVLMDAVEDTGPVLLAGIRPGPESSLLVVSADRISSRRFPSGATLWEQRASPPVRRAALLAAGGSMDLAVISADGIRRLAGGTGEVVWTRGDLHLPDATPVLAVEIDGDGDADLVVQAAPERLEALSGRTGQLLWRFMLDAELVREPLAALSAVESGGSALRLAAGFQWGTVLELDPSPRFSFRAIPNRSTSPPGATDFGLLPNGPGAAPDLVSVQGQSLVRCSTDSGGARWKAGLSGNFSQLKSDEAGAIVVLAAPQEKSVALQAHRAMTGEKLWARVLDGAPGDWRMFPRSGKSPCLAVVLSPAGMPLVLAALDAATGADLWSRTPGGSDCWIGGGDQALDEIVVVVADRPHDPLRPDLNGHASVLSLEDGKERRSFRVLIRDGESASPWFAMLRDLNGDGIADLVLSDRGLVQLVDGATGMVLWSKALPSFFPRDVQGRTEGGRTDLILNGKVHSYGIDPVSGELQWDFLGGLEPLPGDRWLCTWSDSFLPFLHRSSLFDPRTGGKTGTIEIAWRRPGSGGVYYSTGSGMQALLRLPAEFQIHPLEVRPRVRERLSRASVSSAGSLAGWQLLDQLPPRATSFPDTPEGAAKGFLLGLRWADAGLIGRSATLESPDRWIGPELFQKLSTTARANLAEWILLGKNPFLFEAAGITVTTAGARGDAVDLVLSRPAGPYGRSLTARRVNGSWKIVVKAEPALLRALLGITPEQERTETIARMLRNLVEAEQEFMGNDRDGDGIKAYWTGDVSGLFFQKNLNLIERDTALADAAPLPWPGRPDTKPVPRYGYLLRAMRRNAQGRPYAIDLNRDGIEGENNAEFGFCACPADYASTGGATFIVVEHGYPWMKDTGGKWVDQPPERPDLDGWIRVP